MVQARLAELSSGNFIANDTRMGAKARQAKALLADRATWHVPHVETLFVQRKVSGTALLAGGIDIAVHSMKDMPVDQPEGLLIDCYLPREDVRDAFVGAAGGLMAERVTDLHSVRDRVVARVLGRADGATESGWKRS